MRRNQPWRAADQSESFSLLWPPDLPAGSTAGNPQLSQAAWHDLDLEQIVVAFTSDPEHQKMVARILSVLCQDPAILQYRQEVLDDLLSNPQLAERLSAFLPAMDALARYAYAGGPDMNTLHEMTWRVGELQSIVDCIQGMEEVFSSLEGSLRSKGLQTLRGEVAKILENETFQNLRQELPQFLDELRTCASVTIGVNLDQYLRPVEATLVSVNKEKYHSPLLLSRLFGNSGGPMEGITPLQTVPRREVEGRYPFPISSELGWAVEPLMVPLFRDLANVIEKTTKPIVKRLQKYSDIQSHLLVNLRQDLVFYTGALRVIRRMQALGLSTCRPEIAPREERFCSVHEAYNLNLALRLSDKTSEQDLSGQIIRNEIQFGPQGRILILTGPNQGGKTTYLQGVGIVQVLAQAGLQVPGLQARISPVDQIYTHYPLEEKPQAEAGRLGEEARRLEQIFKEVTCFSLVLLNESLSSTSAGESLYLAQDVVRILRRIGLRAIYSTHLHELGGQAEAINAETAGDSRVASLVSSPMDEKSAPGQEIRRSYRIERRPPLGRSYAREIAARYGISYEQLEQGLVERGVLPGNEDQSP